MYDIEKVTDPERRRIYAKEIKIIEKLVDHALAAGYELSVDDGGDEWALERSGDRAAILDALMNTDEDWLYYHDRGSLAACGHVYLVYGNSGWDVISDYNISLEEHLIPVNAFAESLEREG